MKAWLVYKANCEGISCISVYSSAEKARIGWEALRKSLLEEATKGLGDGFDPMYMQMVANLSSSDAQNYPHDTPEMEEVEMDHVNLIG